MLSAGDHSLAGRGIPGIIALRRGSLIFRESVWQVIHVAQRNVDSLQSDSGSRLEAESMCPSAVIARQRPGGKFSGIQSSVCLRLSSTLAMSVWLHRVKGRLLTAFFRQHLWQFSQGGGFQEAVFRVSAPSRTLVPGQAFWGFHRLAAEQFW